MSEARISFCHPEPFDFAQDRPPRSGGEGPDELSRDHHYWVYMMSNKTRSTLYIGVTNDLLLRISQHRRGEIPGFTKDYHCVVLVYCSHFRNIRDAIAWRSS